MFQDDNAPIHRAKRVKNWFQEHESSFAHMIWPPQSPDLNPIENMWDELERELRRCSPLPSSTKELQELLMELWSKLNVDTARKLIESMPRRMRSVIQAKGGPTKY